MFLGGPRTLGGGGGGNEIERRYLIRVIDPPSYFKSQLSISYVNTCNFKEELPMCVKLICHDCRSVPFMIIGEIFPLKAKGNVNYGRLHGSHS